MKLWVKLLYAYTYKIHIGFIMVNQKLKLLKTLWLIEIKQLKNKKKYALEINGNMFKLKH